MITFSIDLSTTMDRHCKDQLDMTLQFLFPFISFMLKKVNNAQSYPMRFKNKKNQILLYYNFSVLIYY